MNRRCYPTKELAVNGAIEQLQHADLIGEQLSIEETNLRHELRCNAALRADRNHRELMRKLGEQMDRTPLTEKELSDLVYPKGSTHE